MTNISAIKRVAPEHHSIALLLPGFLDSNRYLKMEVFAKGLNDLGYATLQLDPCGLWYGGGTEATYNVTAYLADIQQAIQVMLSEIPNPEGVLLLGHSMGAFLAIIAANNLSEVTIVCSLCPPASLEKLAQNPGWQETGFKTSTRTLPENSTEVRTFKLPYSFAQDILQYDAQGIVRNLKARLMIGICLADEAVRVENTEKLVASANAPYVVEFDGLDHHFNNTLEGTQAVWKRIAAFLRQ